MKLSVFTVMLPDLQPEEAAKALKDIGYSGVEWRVTHIPDKQKHEEPSFWGNNYCTFEPTEEAAHEAQALSQTFRLETPNIGSYIDLGDISSVEAAIRFAKILGSPQFRVGLGNYQGNYHKHFEDAKAFLEDVVSLAEEHRVKALIELHHQTIVPSCSLMHRLVQHFDPRYLGVIHDAGNMVHEGFENYQMGLELLGEYLSHVHIKNAAYQVVDKGVSRAVWSDVGAGVVDFGALFKALKAVGYNGYLSVEDFSQTYASLESLEHNFCFISEAWDKA